MNALSTLRIAPLFVSVALLAACGGAPPPEPPPSPLIPPPPSGDEAKADPMMDDEAEEPAPTEPVAKPTWGAMSEDQKREHMKVAVMPKMSAEFKAFDADEFGQMSCATCHGRSAKEGKFQMPNTGLPKLSPDGKWDKLDQKAIAFMKTKVVPEMAVLLDAKPYDPATQQGFGCFGCHTPKK
jgi:cytochrome c553